MSTKLKILIVEDDAAVIKSLCLACDALNYSSFHYFSKNAYDGLKSDYDVVLIGKYLQKDYRNSNAALAEAINIGNVPIVFVTDHTLSITGQNFMCEPHAYFQTGSGCAALFSSIQTAINYHDNNLFAGPGLPFPSSPPYFFIRSGGVRVKLEWKNIFCIKEEETYVKIYSLTGEMFAICPPLRFVVESLLPENTQRKFLKVNRRLYINKEFITARTEKEILCGGHKFENTEHASLSLPRSQ